MSWDEVNTWRQKTNKSFNTTLEFCYNAAHKQCGTAEGVSCAELRKALSLLCERSAVPISDSDATQALAGEADKTMTLDEWKTAVTAFVDSKTSGAKVSIRQDPPHEFYGSWENVEKVKAEYLTKPAYEIDVNGVKIKLHHNSAGVEKHSSCMANHLTEELYNQLKDRVTVNGVTLDKCIKTGIENPGHPAIKTVGMTAGDVESYEVFKELFDPVIDERHGGYGADAKHPSDMDASKIKDPSIIDESYVISTRVRSGRSVQGIPLPPSCNKEERRKLESIVTKALTKLEGELAGDYFPLAGSQSYEPKPGGMTSEEEEKLRTDHFLFQEPDSTLLISGAMHRDWPDARGIYHNKDKNALVWLNEEDHLRIISMQMGPDIKAVFTRFANLCAAVEKVVTEEGYSFAHSEHLGYILTCPSNLGTGLRASMMVKLPNLGKHPDFKKMAGELGIQVRGSAGVDSGFTGVFDLSNSARLGKSEVDLINIMIDGVAALIAKEKELAAAAPAAEEEKKEDGAEAKAE
jgi:creatine kinase|mmetsp:Transcript_3510/g.5168  ORF Transcript_3510/g.5168 Transcript_3510/m.5168 type:complete len:520 (-) Transcript_3510:86-1645(-)|eukprot:CAMPEP_0175096338 /NCGR_PEP_ID=MMETSP0086_2-20121207/4676_1 /TAXON_ID=136419 /ORGANISM="Unknown Unknown, Strain D1" /LENGTH=519 /DNA_ID=CAMNT_0016369727 /DNA_START=36 /DNA_END=1595 /DNA_ORIENTATION=-